MSHGNNFDVQQFSLTLPLSLSLSLYVLPIQIPLPFSSKEYNQKFDLNHTICVYISQLKDHTNSDPRSSDRLFSIVRCMSVFYLCTHLALVRFSARPLCVDQSALKQPEAAQAAPAFSPSSGSPPGIILR